MRFGYLVLIFFFGLYIFCEHGQKEQDENVKQTLLTLTTPDPVASELPYCRQHPNACSQGGGVKTRMVQDYFDVKDNIAEIKAAQKAWEMQGGDNGNTMSNHSSDTSVSFASSSNSNN